MSVRFFIKYIGGIAAKKQSGGTYAATYGGTLKFLEEIL